MKDKLLKFFFWYFGKGALPYWFILCVDSFIVVFSGLFAQVLYAGFYSTVTNIFGITSSLCCYLLGYLIGSTYYDKSAFGRTSRRRTAY